MVTLEMVITVPTALGVGRAGIFYGLAKSRKYDGLNVNGQKIADEPLKQGETRRKPCPVKRPRKEEKKMNRYYAKIENGNLLYSAYADDLKGLLFEMGMHAIDFIFDKGKENCELFTLQIYDAEKHENVYYTTICNVHGSIETVAERYENDEE